AGLIGGVTASQIDGDESAGYNKLGLQGGARGIVRLTKRTDASVEILYTQRGAKSRFVKDRYDPFTYSIRLDYIEIPVQWHYKDWRVDGEGRAPDWYKASFNIGLMFARYMGAGNAKGEVMGLDIVANDYLKKNDLSFVIGANLLTSPHFGFTFRYMRSLFSMYDPRDYNPAPYQNSLISHALNFQMFYLF
ncbi:MAG: PorT family protein, partial [Saprospiraceae bacterium]|nr:PorT family protein [Saprospiraceae bacterium]